MVFWIPEFQNTMFWIPEFQISISTLQYPAIFVYGHFVVYSKKSFHFICVNFKNWGSILLGVEVGLGNDHFNQFAKTSNFFKDFHRWCILGKLGSYFWYKLIPFSTLYSWLFIPFLDFFPVLVILLSRFFPWLIC